MCIIRSHIGVALAGLLVQACSTRSDESVSAPAPPMPSEWDAATPESMQVAEDARRGARSSEPPFPVWCERAGAEIGARIQLANAMVFSYLDRQETNCETAALSSALTDDQYESWLEYLTDYTYLLFWCPMPYEITGGISAFGLANVAVTGAAPVPLGRDDAERLIDMYIAALAEHLMLGEAERMQLAGYLWSTAEGAIEPTLSQALSVCP